MANTFHGGGAQSPTSLSKPIEKVFEDAQHTGEIQLNCRKLREYPKMAGKYDLVDTISADISRNRLNEVPKEICAYLSMEKIQCYHNVIKSIPEAIVQLQALTYLNLSRNQLSIIPSFISQLQTLEVIIASHNRLVSLPEEIGVLDRLMELDVSCNEISHLPVQIGDLKSLKSLNVRRNLLEILPVEISKLNLRKIDISGNRISKIPTVFRRIETLEDIVLHDNPLTMPPAHVCTKGKQHIMKHLEIVANREDKQRGILNEAEMKRFRKSLPPQQSVSSEEFRNLMDSPDKWKRHTVLSSDSGYSTTDSIDKISWSPQETNNSEAPHLVNGTPLAVSTAHGRLVTDPRTLPERDSKREPPPPPLRVNSRLSPEKYVSSQDKYSPPSTLLGPAAQNRGPPTPPTLFPNSPQTPLTPPTPQGPGPGLGTCLAQSPGPILGTSLEDEFTRELQRQKAEYENKKKLAEQLRIQQEEEEEREQRRRAAQRIQDEQRAMLERQREETRLMEEKRAWEEARQREVEEAKRQEELRLAEEARRAEEMKKAEEARRQEEERAQSEAKQQRVDSNNYYLNNHHHNYRPAPSSPAWPPPPSPSLLRHYDQRTQNQQPQRLHSPASPGHYGQSGIPSPGHYGQSGIPSPGHSQYPGQGPSPLTTDHFRAQNPNSPSYNPSRPSNIGQVDHSGHSGSHGYGHYGDPGSYDTSPRDHHPQGASPRAQYSNELHSRLNPYGQSDDQSPADRRSDQDSPDYVRADHQHGSPFGQTNSMGLDPYSGYRKPALSASNSFKEERRPGPGTQYRRTTSDSNQRLPANVQQGGSQLQSNTVITNGPILEQPSMNGSGPTPRNTASPNTPSSQQQHVPGTRTEPVSNGQAGDRAPTTTQGTVSRKPKTSAPVTTSRVAKPTDRLGRATPTTTRTGVPTARKSNMNQDEELRKSTQSLKGASDATTKNRGEQRLRTIQKEAVNNYMNRRSSGSTSSEDDRKRSTPTRTGLPTSTAATSKRAGTGMSSTRTPTTTSRSTASRPTTSRVGVPTVATGASTQQRRARQNSTSSTTSVSSTASKSSVVDKSKRGGAVMTNAQVKLLEDYNKESTPGFRRHHDTSEQMDILRKTISTRLKRTLPDSLSEALSDGVLLCHLANQIRPRSVASVHVPSPAVPKLTPAKCRRNVENFLEACRKIGVSKGEICGASDILEEKGLNRVAMSVAALVAIATNPKHQPATNV